MTYSLRLTNGDISISGPGGLATISGSQKLLQDLRCALLEPRGSDPMHPDWGSNLDGGLLPDGSEAASLMGEPTSNETAILIESEVRRILNSYQQQQADRLAHETATYAGKNTFSAEELLASIDMIRVTQSFTTFFVHISLTTASGDSIAFTTPVST